MKISKEEIQKVMQRRICSPVNGSFDLESLTKILVDFDERLEKLEEVNQKNIQKEIDEFKSGGGGMAIDK